MRRPIILLAAFALAATLTGGPVAVAHPDHGPEYWNPEDGGAYSRFHDQHGEEAGHLPATQQNVRLVSKIQLTGVPGGIADVGYFEGFAYLNKFSPECADREGGTGTGVEIVDVRDPANPVNVGFIPAEPNSYVGEGISVITYQGRDILVHNNETCNSTNPVVSGVSVWDVTDPFAPVPLGQFGDTTPAVANQTYHTVHSTQAFVWNDQAYFIAQDNQDLKDIDIFDMTPAILGTGPGVLVSETGLEDWPGAQGSYANGDTVFHHDMQFKIIDGHAHLLASYWDAGQVLLNIDDPASPVFVGDSDYGTPDPEMPAFATREGNSHESYFSSNNKYILSTDEDFSPFRTQFDLTSGPNAGTYGAGEFGFTPPIDSLPDGTLNGPTVFGGRGCFNAGPNAGPDAVAGEPQPVPAGEIEAGPGEEKTVVFSRGGCFFSTKIAAGQDLGYNAVIIGQSHGGTRNGLLKDAFFCGGQGHDYDEAIPAACIGHRAMHTMFNDEASYSGAEGGDIDLSARGETYRATTLFDGWGYTNLHDATDPDLPIIGTYAVPEALNEDYAQGFGDLSVHEVKTDPRPGINLAYFSYYSAGVRVAEFGPSGITEVGRYIDEGGNNFWGVFPIGDENCGHGYAGCPIDVGNGVRPLILASDRDFGLYILDYTGKKPRKD